MLASNRGCSFCVLSLFPSVFLFFLPSLTVVCVGEYFVDGCLELGRGRRCAIDGLPVLEIEDGDGC